MPASVERSPSGRARRLPALAASLAFALHGLASSGLLLSFLVLPGRAAAEGPKLELGTWEVRVNTRTVDGAIFAARDPSGGLYVDEAALERWKVRLPRAPRAEIDGLAMLRIDAVPGTRHRVDERRQAIEIDFSPEQLAGSRFDARPVDRIPPAQAPHWGGFFNYSLFGYTSGGSTDAAGLFEAAVFGPQGTGLARFGANTATATGNTGRLVRLDTSWRRDEPGELRSLVLGDSISRPGFYGRPVRFGGIQYGKNFSLQPGFIVTPMLGLSGTAAVPSTVDVFVNNQRVLTQQVEPGPFTIDNVPAVSGSGDVQLVVRDAFGQQQVISQSFYASPTLLAPGLDDFAFSLGAQRRDYGLDSGDYGDAQAMALWRRGITRSLTLEGRAEADDSVRSAGVAADLMIGKLGIASAGAAASSGDAGSGSLWMAGFDHQARRYSFGLRGTFASAGFRQVGDDGTFTTPESSVTARAAVNLGSYGSMGLAFVSQRYHEPIRPSVDTGTVTWSTRVGRLANLSMSVSRVQSAENDTTLFTAVSIPLGRETIASAGAIQRLAGSGGGNRQNLALQKALPAFGEGWGYNLYASSDRRAEAGAMLATRIARIGAELADANGTTAARVSIEGGVGSVAGHTFLARPIVESFAVVSAGGVGGLEVLQENQPVGRTDERGLLVLTPLRSYAPNRVTIDPMSAPMDVSLGASTRQAVPMWRSGLLLEFDVKRGRSAIVRLLAPDGTPLPVSARVRNLGSGEALPVGLDGEVFVTALTDSGTRLAIEAGGKRCEVEVRPVGEDPVLELGPFPCRSGS